MQITAEQMMVADIDVVRQQVIAEMTAQQPKAVLQRRLLTASQGARVQAAPDMPVPKIAPLRPRGYRRVTELDSPQSTLALRSGVVEAAGTRKCAWPRKSPSGSPNSMRGTRKMQDTTLTEMMTAAIAAVREQVAAKGTDMQAVTEQNKAASRIAAMDRPMPIEQHFEKPALYTVVGARGRRPAIARRIREACMRNEDDKEHPRNDVAVRH